MLHIVLLCYANIEQDGTRWINVRQSAQGNGIEKKKTTVDATSLPPKQIAAAGSGIRRVTFCMHILISKIM